MAAQSRPSIKIGPEILVSRDGNVAHVEIHAAAHPTDPRNLIAGAITMTRPEGGSATKVYATQDGGYSWRDVQFPEQSERGGGDPIVAFGADGAALFLTLAYVTDSTGRTRAALHVYRSADGGRHWSGPVDLGVSYDHQQVAVDYTGGPRHGTIYLSALHGYPVYRVGVFRSTDGGRSFSGPSEAANGRGELGINATGNLVLSDGTLIVTFVDFPFKPEQRRPGSRVRSTLWSVESHDGGLSFSPPRRIAAYEVELNDASRRLTTFPQFAADHGSAGFRDRMYAVWTDLSAGGGRIRLAYSTDRGKTWSAPEPIDVSVPPRAQQYQPAIAVSSEGAVGVSWFDTRDDPRSRDYGQYFSVSLDGGGSFLPPRRVSTAPSVVYGSGNLTLAPSTFRVGRHGDSLFLSMLSAADRYPAGGDYMGLTADARGHFHLIWADARSGTFQIYASRAWLEGGAVSTGAPGGPATDVTRSVEPVFDPTSYDSVTHELRMPIRIRNRSSGPLLRPIIVRLSGFAGEAAPGEAPDSSRALALLNPSDGRRGSGDGGGLDYSPALGDLAALEPGAVTSALVWRLRVPDPQRLPRLRINVPAARPR